MAHTIKSDSENAELLCNGLREFEPPPTVKVYKATPDGKVGRFLREDPIKPYITEFNTEVKGK